MIQDFKNYNHRYNEYLREYGPYGFFIVQSLLYPIEKLKIMQQVNESYPEIMDKTNEFSFKGTIKNYVEKNMETEILATQYRGFACKVSSYTIKEFGFYYLCEKHYQSKNPYDSRKEPVNHFAFNFCYNFLMGGTLEILAFPFEKAKTILMMDCQSVEQRIYRSPFSALLQQAENTGSGIFKGLGVTILGGAIYRGLQIGIFEGLMSLGLNDYGWYFQLPVSIFATIIGQKAAYPLDTYRRKLFVQGTDYEVDLKAYKKFQAAFREKLMIGWGIQYYKSFYSGVALFFYKGIYSLVNYRQQQLTA